MALTDLERTELEEAIRNISPEFAGFTFADFNKNPNKYANADILRLVLYDLSSPAEAEKIKQNVISTLQNFIPPDTTSFVDSSGNVRSIGPDRRIIQVTDKDGNPVMENGIPKTVTVKEGSFFPTSNFINNFVQTINTDQQALMAIQDAAVNAGLITIEELGNEVNGTGGIVTNAIINEALQYIDTQYNKWYPNSLERENFIAEVDEAKDTNKFYPNINSFFGGLKTGDENNPINTNYITSKEIFANGFLEYLNVKQQQSDLEKRQFDIEAASKIKAQNIMPSMTTLAQEFEDYYQSVNNRPISNELKAEFINEVAANWSPYVDALIAQDKSIRANEVYNTYYDTFNTVEPITERPVTKYVELGVKPKPEFEVENPTEVIKDKISDKAEKQSELSTEAANVAQAQFEYMKWLQGG